MAISFQGSASWFCCGGPLDPSCPALHKDGCCGLNCQPSKAGCAWPNVLNHPNYAAKCRPDLSQLVCGQLMTIGNDCSPLLRPVNPIIMDCGPGTDVLCGQITCMQCEIPNHPCDAIVDLTPAMFVQLAPLDVGRFAATVTPGATT